MKLRVFSISLLVGLISAVLVTALHVSYLRSERLSLLDEQLRETATALLNTELAELRRGEYGQAEDIITEELGPQRIGKIFVIRNEKGEVLFQSQSARLLERQIPQTPSWVTFTEDDRAIRVLNLALPKIPDRTLQVGAFLETNVFGWTQPNWRTGFYTLAVLAVIASASFFLSSLVMRPFRRLHGHLELVGRDLSQFKTVPKIPLGDFRFMLTLGQDEFGRTLRMLNDLIERINWTGQITRLWSVRLAHELKTPITVLRLEAEDPALGKELRESMLGEIDRMAKLIGGFLSWAEAGSEVSAAAPRPVSLSGATAAVVERLNKIAVGRLSLVLESDWSARILPEHLDLILTNLIENALKYSPSLSQVVIAVRDGEIEIVDEGPGLPEKVRESLGLPFNRGDGRRDVMTSSGLGLALVHVLCRRHGWKISFEKTPAGHRVLIRADQNADNI